MYYQRHGWNIWYNEHCMSKSISHAVSTIDLYHPSGRWPLGWYRVPGLIRHVIQILTCNIQYVIVLTVWYVLLYFDILYFCNCSDSVVFFFPFYYKLSRNTNIFEFCLFLRFKGALATGYTCRPWYDLQVTNDNTRIHLSTMVWFTGNH